MSTPTGRMGFHYSTDVQIILHTFEHNCTIATHLREVITYAHAAEDGAGSIIRNIAGLYEGHAHPPSSH